MLNFLFHTTPILCLSTYPIMVNTISSPNANTLSLSVHSVGDVVAKVVLWIQRNRSLRIFQHCHRNKNYFFKPNDTFDPRNLGCRLAKGTEEKTFKNDSASTKFIACLLRLFRWNVRGTLPKWIFTFEMIMIVSSIRCVVYEAHIPHW